MRLPVDAIIPQVLATLSKGSPVVVTAPPGSGKTTRIPPALLQDIEGRILVSQPRRIAARSAARRMAEESGTPLGEVFGYRTRYESCCRADTRVVVVTDGLLVRMVREDPFLDGVGAVVLDEFHERSLPVDLSCAFIREIMADARPELRLVIMSATLEAESVARFIDGRIIEADAGLHPLELDWDRIHDERSLHLRCASAIVEVLHERDGDILVFLPGAADIRRVSARLEEIGLSRDIEVMPLHGELGAESQDRALQPSSRRKVILATNIAETSLTVPGVRNVIDSGVAKVLRRDRRLGLDRLEEERISLASARQRSGRAAREAAGYARRLWTRSEERQMKEQPEAAIRRLDLSSAILEVLDWGASNPATFGWFEKPDDADSTGALAFLQEIGAVVPAADGWALTTIGRSLCALPMHPRLGRLLLESRRLGTAEFGALACVLLGERDILSIDKRRGLAVALTGTSDLQHRIDLLVSHDRSVSAGLRRRLLRSASRLQGRHTSDVAAEPEEALRRAVLAAFPDRLVRRRGDSKRGTMVGGRGVVLTDESLVGDAPLFCALRLQAGRRGQGSESPVTWASAVDESWLDEQFPGEVITQDEALFDPGAFRVVGRRRRSFRGLTLDERPVNLSDGGMSGEALEAGVRAHQTAVLSRLLDDETAALLRRLVFLREHAPEREWPDLGEGGLIAIIAARCAGRSRLEELGPLVAMVESELGYQTMTLVNEQAPTGMMLPSGRRARLTYEEKLTPKLSARVQDFFGLLETPRLAWGRVAVRVELLAPNNRAVQITSDLASFWRETYARVRKDLRGRYPKHKWPEVPPGL